MLVAASAYFFTTVWMTMRLDQYANSYVNGWVDLPGPKMILNQTERSITTKASSNLPYFVLHVGPQKTMSSAIQCSLLKLKPFLAQDDYVFIGKVDARACGKNGIPIDPALIAPFSKRACVNEMLEAVRTAATKDDENSGLQSVQCWTDFTKALSDLNSTNIILSEEKLSETHLFGFPDMTESLWKILQDQLKDKFQFQLCVVYRRYYEWLASVKNQGDKYSLGRRGIKAWDGPVKVSYFLFS